MWENAKSLDLYYKEGKEAGLTFCEMRSKLEFIELYQAPYGDWLLYRDDMGNLWQDYISIGD